MSYLAFKANPPLPILFTLVTNLSDTVFLTTSFLTTLLNLLKSTRTVFNCLHLHSSTSTFRLAKSDFAANLDVSASVAFFNSAFYNSAFFNSRQT